MKYELATMPLITSIRVAVQFFWKRADNEVPCHVCCVPWVFCLVKALFAFKLSVSVDPSFLQYKKKYLQTFSYCWFIPEGRVNILLFFIGCLPLSAWRWATSIVGKEVHLRRYCDTDVPWEFKIKGVMIRIDVLTMHQWYWISDHWIDTSIQSDGSLHPWWERLYDKNPQQSVSVSHWRFSFLLWSPHSEI